MKKVLLLVALVLIFVGLSCICANAETYGALTYEVSNGAITITDCDTSVTEVEIPNDIGYPVKAIDVFAFSGCSRLEKVIIPDSVIDVDYDAFGGCTALKEITVPKDIYGERHASRFGYIFGYTIKLSEPIPFTSLNYGVKYPDVDIRYTEGEYAIPGMIYQNYTEGYVEDTGNLSGYRYNGYRRYYFYEIPSSLKKVTITNDEVINSSAFYNCSNIEEIVLNNKITSIETDAFYNCSNLKTVYFNGTEDDWNDIAISSGNDSILSAEKKFFFYVKGIDENGEAVFDEMVDVNSVISVPEKAGYITKLYTDAERTNVFDSTMPVTENMTLYVSYEQMPATKTDVYKYEQFKMFTVSPINIEKGNRVFLGLYDRGRFVEAHTADYDGEDIVFITDKSYTEAKVMVWDEKDALKPVCEVEIAE